jgi:NAD(P)-dependent dehydrogenase (short-subunit alcohol dehydrogenase family)
VSLKGRVAIVTGGSQGLGLAIAEALSRENAELLLGAREPCALEAAHAKLQAGGAVAHWQVLDVADPASVEAFVTKARSLWGRLDILVNNAGIYGPKGPVEDLDWPAWEQTLRINLFGTVLMCRACLPLLLKSPRAKIINLSGGGATAPLPRLSAYATSKAAVVRFTETLAEEVKGRNLDVNAVAPGALNTRLLDEVIEAGPAKVGEDFYRRALHQKTEGGTPLVAGAELCAWLASPQSDGITGRLISAVWDSWRSLPEHREALQASDIYTLRRIVPKDRGLDWKEHN